MVSFICVQTVEHQQVLRFWILEVLVEYILEICTFITDPSGRETDLRRFYVTEAEIRRREDRNSLPLAFHKNFVSHAVDTDSGGT